MVSVPCVSGFTQPLLFVLLQNENKTSTRRHRPSPPDLHATSRVMAASSSSSATSLLPAHDLTSTSSVPRTADVTLGDDRAFADFHLPARVLQGLHRAGFVRPSPVQARAIPGAVLGVDVIVQAKSGTGKTLVFVVAALTGIERDLKGARKDGGQQDGEKKEEDEGQQFGPKVLILAPTREIAVQATRVAMDVSAGMRELRVHALIGGMSKEVSEKKRGFIPPPPPPAHTKAQDSSVAIYDRTT